MYSKSIIQKLKALNLRRFEIDLCLEILQYFKILKRSGNVSKKLHYIFPKNITLSKKFKVCETLIKRAIKALKEIKEIEAIYFKKYKFTEKGEIQFYTFRKIIILEGKELKELLKSKTFKKAYKNIIQSPVLTKYELFLRSHSKNYCKSIKNVKLTLKYDKESDIIFEHLKTKHKNTMFFS
jgi:hypothetical protein